MYKITALKSMFLSHTQTILAKRSIMASIKVGRNMLELLGVAVDNFSAPVLLVMLFLIYTRAQLSITDTCIKIND